MTMSRYLIFVLLLLGVFSSVTRAQSAIRIGVIDRVDGPIARGAYLAAMQINAAGGVIGADRSVYEIKVVVTSPDHMEIAAANMVQANAFAILAPGTTGQMLAYMKVPENINVPVLTSAADDTILLQDNTRRVFRSGAQELLQNRALASYLVNTVGIRTITTVQLDAQSTASLIGFATALSELRVGASNLLYNDAHSNIFAIADRIVRERPDAVGLYGPPILAAQVYGQMRTAGYDGVVSYSQATDPGFVNFVPSDLLPGIISASNWSFSAADAASRQFVVEFVNAFGAVPDGLSAASYDSVGMLAQAYRRPGDLAENLAAIREYSGVQGIMTPADLPQGETSSNVMITQFNEFGTPNIVARFHGNVPQANAELVVTFDTPTPIPTPTPSGYNLTIQSAYQNVRSGPGLNYDVIGQLQRGTQARVIGATTDFSWLVVDFRGQWGWLASYLVETYGNRNLVPIIQPPLSPTPPATATTAPPIYPDLVILNAYPSRITLDQPTLVNVIVRNQGLGGASSFAIAATFQPGSRYAGVNVPFLVGGQQTTVQLEQSLTGTSGPQSVTIVTDLNQQVFEGSAGEANNSVYIYNYIADRAVVSNGSWTIATGSVDLDGNGNVDLLWNGNELIALNGGGLYLMTEFNRLHDVYSDAIATGLATASTLNVDLLQNAVVGMVTSGGNRAVVQVMDVSINGSITMDYRVYR